MGRINSSNNYAQNRRQMVMRSQEAARQNGGDENKIQIPQLYASVYSEEEGAEFMRRQNGAGTKTGKAAAAAATTVEPDKQENPRQEFVIYADAKLNDLNKQIEAEKRPLQKKWMEMKRNRFIHKKDYFVDRMDKNSQWTAPDYEHKLKREFHDYDKVLDEKRQEVKQSISTTITQINVGLEESIDKMTQAVQVVSSDVSKSQALLAQAQQGLATATKGREDAAKVLTGEENEGEVLAKYDAIIKLYNDLITQLQTNVNGLSGDQSSLQSILDQLNNQKKQLDDISAKAAAETDVVKLVGLQDKLTSLQGNISQSISDSKSTIQTMPPVDEIKTNTTLEDLKSRTETAAVPVNAAKVKQQSNTKDPSSLTEEQILTLAAVVLSEGAIDYSSREIVWVYINNMRTMGFEGSLRTSAAYSVNGRKDSTPDHNENYKAWMVTLGAQEQFEGVKPRNPASALKLLKYIKDDVLGNLKSNPFPSFTSQGYSGDLNNPKNEDYWCQARQYLRLWLQGKVPGGYMEIVGSGTNTTYLFNSGGIVDYFKKNPSLLPSNRSEIPPIMWDDNKGVLTIDGKEIKATRK